MNFLANENFPGTSIQILRGAGQDVASVIEDMPGIKDFNVLKRAYEENRIILTFDRDYGELIYKYRSVTPGGVVYFRFDPFTPEEPAQILLDILKSGRLPILGKFTVVERRGVRQRTLREIK